jgi:hypothetical protein
LLALARKPRESERAAMAEFLEREYQERLRESPPRAPLAPDAAGHEALVQLCRALFNINEFVYPD